VSTPPPQIQAALAQLGKALAATEGRDVDPMTASWDEIEKGVIKLLGGAFSPGEESHQGLVFMLAAALAERLRRDLDAFWFHNRATPQGAALGFPAGIIVFSPFGSVAQALGRGRLALLDEVTAELGKVVAQARAQDLLAPGAPSQPPLAPEDYQRLFDPGFVQFVSLRVAEAQTSWQRTPGAESRELEEAFTRVSKQVPREAREGLRRQLVEALGQLDAGKPVAAQIDAAPQLAELLALIHGGSAQTGFAPSELWQGVLMPLLHIGAPAGFPAPDEEVLENYRRGVPPVFLYVDTVPYQSPAADEDGVLGVFPFEEMQVIDPAFRGAESVRLAQVDPEVLRELTAAFDPAAVRASVERFTAALVTAAGGPAAAEARPGEPSLLDVALVLLEDLGRVVRDAEEKDAALCIRNATESEAGSEPLLQELRRALTGPRIILP
jgi:hypothetical protein